MRKVDECNIVERLLDLLHSSSFTVVQNSLGALGPLVQRHRKVQERICANAPALSVLYFLRDSKRDDLRNSARAIISDLNSSALATRSMPHNATLSSGRRNYDAKGTNPIRNRFSVLRFPDAPCFFLRANILI